MSSCTIPQWKVGGKLVNWIWVTTDGFKGDWKKDLATLRMWSLRVKFAALSPAVIWNAEPPYYETEMVTFAYLEKYTKKVCVAILGRKRGYWNSYTWERSRSLEQHLRAREQSHAADLRGNLIHEWTTQKSSQWRRVQKSRS